MSSATVFPIWTLILGKPTDNFAYIALAAAAHRGETLGPQRVDVCLDPREQR